MKKEKVIDSCYSVLRNVTPFFFDCGKICDSRCCKGDNKTGMLLFPGEEKFVDKSFNIIEKDENHFVVCGGCCNRNNRPLSCMIYPLFPVIKTVDGKQTIEVIFDPRANCTLTSGEFEILRKFCKRVKRVGKYLLLNDETAAFYRALSEEIVEIENLKHLLG